LAVERAGKKEERKLEETKAKPGKDEDRSTIIKARLNFAEYGCRDMESAFLESVQLQQEKEESKYKNI